MSTPISKTYLGVIDGVPTYLYWFQPRYLHGEPVKVIGPDPLTPIDPNLPVRWINHAETYDKTK